MSDKVGFAKYGKTFQEGLVQLIFKIDPSQIRLQKCSTLTSIELEYLRVFLQKNAQLRHRYHKHPSVDAMLTIIKTELGAKRRGD